jgi:tripartite-type tricarboxylate transporter receptor subunit TctC
MNDGYCLNGNRLRVTSGLGTYGLDSSTYQTEIADKPADFKPADFAYLGNLVRDPSAFSVTVDSPYKSIADLVAAAKKAPGTISYGSTGVGTDDHLQMVMFEEATGTKLLHAPYQGAGPLRAAMMGGHVVVGGLNLGEAMPHAGKTMRPLAHASDKRSSLAPEVPTFKEQGVAIEIASERGIVAARGLPPEIEQRIAEALRQVAANPEFQAQMKAQFTELDYLPGADWKKRPWPACLPARRPRRPGPPSPSPSWCPSPRAARRT